MLLVCALHLDTKELEDNAEVPSMSGLITMLASSFLFDLWNRLHSESKFIFFYIFSVG